MKNHEFYFEKAAEQARLATCHRAKCGSVIVTKTGEIIGEGFNCPPLNREELRLCEADLDLSIKPKYDKTCCIHAEWNAIINALKNHGSKIDGGTLYFMRVDADGKWTGAGKPFCTVCSRLALQSGLKNFALWDELTKSPKIYDVIAYNTESYNYYAKK